MFTLLTPDTMEQLYIVFVKDIDTGRALEPEAFFLIRKSDADAGLVTSDRLISLRNYPALLPQIDEAIRAGEGSSSFWTADLKRF